MIVAPSMLSADFGNLKRDVEMVNESEAGLFHLDIMDGVFVPNISYGFPVVKSIAKAARKPMDAHLMIVAPDRYVSQFADMGVESLSVHYEACTHLHRSLTNIRNLGMKAGVALNPHTNVQLIEDVLDCCDFVLIMSVNPGFGGQSFMADMMPKVTAIRALLDKHNPACELEVDGGVDPVTCKVVIENGANVLVAGSAVYKAEDIPARIAELRG